jgi:hypothetical protein
MFHQRDGPSGGDAGARKKHGVGGIPKRHRPTPITDHLQARSNSPPQFIAAYDYFDVIRLRLREQPPENLLEFLRKHSNGARLKQGNPILGFIRDFLLIHVPRRPALLAIAKLPGAMVNHVQPAYDLILPAPITSQRFQTVFNPHFLQGWHGSRHSNYDCFRTTSYTSEKYERGRKFDWYWDEPCRVSGEHCGELNCFHWEGRHEGKREVGTIGIHGPVDLLHFDFEDYRRKYLQLFRLDFERLGRFDSNRRHKSRRRYPLITKSGKNYDRMVGIFVYNKFGRHPDWIGDEAGNQPEEYLPTSLQSFATRYGRGDYLKPVTLLDLLKKAQKTY